MECTCSLINFMTVFLFLFIIQLSSLRYTVITDEFINFKTSRCQKHIYIYIYIFDVNSTAVINSR